jgi:hypothetical protein
MKKLLLSIFFAGIIIGGTFPFDALAITEANCKATQGLCRGKSASTQQYCNSNETQGERCETNQLNATFCCTKTTTPPAGSPAAVCSAPNHCVDVESKKCPSGETKISGTCPATGFCCAPAGSAGPGGTAGSGGGTGSLGATQAVDIQLANPLRFSTVDGVLTSVMGALKGIVVTLAILMIVIGAIMYILSFGNPDNIKRAKNIIFAALIGLAIVIAAPAFLREIYSLLDGDVPAIPGDGTQLTLTQIATNILKFLLSLVGILALIVMIIAAIMLFASFGNPDKRKAALEVLKNAILGVVLAMGSMILVTTVARFFE